MNTKQFILKSAIGVFAFSTILSGCVMVFGQKKPNYFNITIPASAAKLALCFSMMGTGLTMFIGSRIEAVQFEESLKPRPVHTPCRGCKHFHGVVYNGVTLNCAVHPRGWQNVPFAAFNPFFYLAFIISVGVQVIEAHALRGKNPDSARRELQDHMVYELETKPSGKIDLVGQFWADYKTAGIRDRSSAGLVVIAVWAFDIITTFAARNPFEFTAPFMILGCILFNIGTMMAGEIGFAIWRLTKD